MRTAEPEGSLERHSARDCSRFWWAEAPEEESIETTREEREATCAACMPP